MLEAQSDTLNVLSQSGSTFNAALATSPQSQHSHAMPMIPAMSVDMTEALPPLTIPLQHRTSSNYLLTLPMMKSLIGENPPDLFYRLEARKPVPAALATDQLHLNSSSNPLSGFTSSEADQLAASFFANAHPTHPVLDQDEFWAIYDVFKQSLLGDTLEGALCMVVLAVGAVAQSAPDTYLFSETPPGMYLMQKALPTLIFQASWSFSSNLLLPQALVLASVYFAYIVRPLQSWKLIQAASSNLQLRLAGRGVLEQSTSRKETIIRLFWSCFLIECDRLAELELPRSGLEQLVDSISLPDCTNLGLMQSTCYLAEISVRRLLNRIHNSLYPRKEHFLSVSTASLTAPGNLSPTEITSIMSICDELYSQLETWHTSIPEDYRPSLDTPMSTEHNDREAILRIRYYAARHIIWRPFVIYIANHGMANASTAIYDRAVICLESCRKYIQSTTLVLQRPSMYTWTFSLSSVPSLFIKRKHCANVVKQLRSLGAIIILTMASLSPDMKHLVPDIDELQSSVIENIRPWGFSSLDSVVSILEDMQRKCRRLSRVHASV